MNNIPTEMNLIAIKEEPQEDTERKSSISEVELKTIAIEPKQEEDEDVISFLTQQQFIINEDLGIKEHDKLSIPQHSNDNQTKRLHSSPNDFISAYKQFLAVGKEQHGSGRKGDLVPHMKRVRRFICDQCGCFTTTCKEQFVSHIKSQHSVTEYKCSQCNYVSISKNSLSTHFNRCHGLQKFCCGQCNYTTKIRSYLVRHIKRIHLFSYDQCGFAAMFKEQLLSHIKNQYGLTEYKCVQCNYSSMTKQYLIKHIKRRHGLKKFACALCNYRSRIKDYLVLHVKRIHKV